MLPRLRATACTVLTLLLTLTPALTAQQTAAGARAQQTAAKLLSMACGPNGASFQVRRQGPLRSPFRPQGKNARVVVFVEPFGFVSGCEYVRVGIDGKWIGAACEGTWIDKDVKPGIHHLCVDMRRGRRRYPALEGFNAKAGKTYYYRANVIWVEGALDAVLLEPIGDEEGRYLQTVGQTSVSKAKNGGPH